MELFRASKLKIERANKHIVELNSVVNTYVKGISQVGTQGDPETGTQKFQLSITAPLPNEVPLIIGDVVHNLHTALDMTIWDIIPERDRTIKFPFFERSDELITQINRGKIKAYAPKIADLIITEIKPYKGGNSRLYGLHDLDIMDKHQLLIPIVGKINVRETGQTRTGGGSLIQNLEELNKISDTRNIDIADYANLTFSIVFDKGQSFESKPVIETLHELSEVVSRIIESFEIALGSN